MADVQDRTRVWRNLDLDGLCREVPIGWSAADQEALEAELEPLVALLRHYLGRGEDIPSHLPGTASVCLPITAVDHPDRLFEEAEGSVSSERYEVFEHLDYWITVHHSTVPVVILLPKRPLSTLPRLADLQQRCSRALGRTVGGQSASYFQWNQPRFWWRLHTDDDYEGVESRIHVPLQTSELSLFAWADRFDAQREDWLLARHLERGKVYETRTDVPHTAGNDHPTEGRLHLILDVAPSGAAAESSR